MFGFWDWGSFVARGEPRMKINEGVGDNKVGLISGDN